MSYVSILIRGTILTQKDSGEGSDSVVGTGHSLALQGRAHFWGAGELKVTVKDGAHPQGGGCTDPTGASLGQSRRLAGASPGLCLQAWEAAACGVWLAKKGKQGNQHSLGTFWAPGPMPAL